jgi:hypothetical protein
VTAKPLYSVVNVEIKGDKDDLSTFIAVNVQSRPKHEYAAE